MILCVDDDLGADDGDCDRKRNWKVMKFMGLSTLYTTHTNHNHLNPHPVYALIRRVLILFYVLFLMKLCWFVNIFRFNCCFGHIIEINEFMGGVLYTH